MSPRKLLARWAETYRPKTYGQSVRIAMINRRILTLHRFPERAGILLELK